MEDTDSLTYNTFFGIRTIKMKFYVYFHDSIDTPVIIGLKYKRGPGTHFAKSNVPVMGYNLGQVR